jgi:hypothetical protein
VSVTANTAPPLPTELEAMMRHLKMPYARALAPELLATAKAQRWDPAEVIKALFVEEITGRSRSMLATRRKAAGFPTGKTFATWDEEVSSIPAPTQQALRTLEWLNRRKTWSFADATRNRVAAASTPAAVVTVRLCMRCADIVGLRTLSFRADGTVQRPIGSGRHLHNWDASCGVGSAQGLCL